MDENTSSNVAERILATVARRINPHGQTKCRQRLFFKFLNELLNFLFFGNSQVKRLHLEVKLPIEGDEAEQKTLGL